MFVTTYQKVHDFVQRTRSMLEQHEVASNMILNVAPGPFVRISEFVCKNTNSSPFS